VTDRVPARPLAVDNSAIHKGSTFTGLGMPDVAFLFKNAKRGEDRVVRESRLAAEGGGNFPDGGGASIPHNIHETKFRFGQVEGFFSWQARLHQLRN